MAWVNAIEAIKSAVGIMFRRRTVRLSSQFVLSDDPDNEETVIEIDPAVAGAKGDKGDKGDPGSNGSNGADGQPAFSSLTLGFTQPAKGTTVSIQASSTAPFTVGSYVMIETGGLYSVVSISDLHNATVRLLETGAVAAGAAVANGSKVLPAGSPAYTRTIATFVQPSIGATVSVQVDNTDWMISGGVVSISNAGLYLVSSVTDSTHVVLQFGNGSAPGTTIAIGESVSPSGIPGATGANGAAGANGKDAYSHSTASFTQPLVGVSASVTIADTAWMLSGMYVFLSTGGTYQVDTVNSPTSANLKNVGYPGNITPGTTIGSGNLSPCGMRGAGAVPARLHSSLTAGHTIPAIGSDAYVSFSDNWSWMDPVNGKRIVLIGELPILTGSPGNFWWGMVNTNDDGSDFYITNIGGNGAAAPGTSISASGVIILQG